MNTIISHQNDQSILDKLSAQRNLYNKAKRLRSIRFGLCVFLVVCLSVSRLIWVDCEVVDTALVVATALALVAEPLLGSTINKRRVLAAQIQQRLDNELYGLEWDDCVCGRELSDELICDIKDSPVDEKLKNWYDVGIGSIEDDRIAILLCQRENISYDSGLRHWYVTLCSWVASILAILVIALSFVEGWDIMKILVFGVLPAISIVEWFTAIFQDNAADSEHLLSLEDLVKSETEKALSGGTISKKSLQKIQNLLFLHRKSGYLIPSWFYRCKRKRSEQRAAYSVSEFLKKYKA